VGDRQQQRASMLEGGVGCVFSLWCKCETNSSGKVRVDKVCITYDGRAGPS
jgi:hypothetical protein